jgi:hypothetical protein
MPARYFRRTKSLVIKNVCAQMGLDCDDELQCVCNPCLRRHDVDVIIQQCVIFENDEEQQLSQSLFLSALAGSKRFTISY